MNDTPRTDALVASHGDSVGLDDLAGYYNELLDHARTLERENAALREYLHAFLSDWRKWGVLSLDRIEQAQKVIDGANPPTSDVHGYAQTLSDFARQVVVDFENNPLGERMADSISGLRAALARNPVAEVPGGEVGKGSTGSTAPAGVVPTNCDSGLPGDDRGFPTLEDEFGAVPARGPSDA